MYIDRIIVNEDRSKAGREKRPSTALSVSRPMTFLSDYERPSKTVSVSPILHTVERNGDKKYPSYGLRKNPIERNKEASSYDFTSRK